MLMGNIGIKMATRVGNAPTYTRIQTEFVYLSRHHPNKNWIVGWSRGFTRNATPSVFRPHTSIAALQNGGSSRIRTYAAFLGADLSLAGTYDTRLCHGSLNGRDSRIRTDDILLPKQALYQAELHPVKIVLYSIKE